MAVEVMAIAAGRGFLVRPGQTPELPKAIEDDLLRAGILRRDDDTQTMTDEPLTFVRRRGRPRKDQK